MVRLSRRSGRSSGPAPPRERAEATPWTHGLHRPGKEGLGVACRAGFAWCLEHVYAVVGRMDVDLSHPPEKLAEMLAMLDSRERTS